MRKMVLVVLVIAALMMFVVPVFADGMTPHCASGQVFGQHVSEMARMGMIGGAGGHVPGMHQGYSLCLNVH